MELFDAGEGHHQVYTSERSLWLQCRKSVKGALKSTRPGFESVLCIISYQIFDK